MQFRFFTIAVHGGDAAVEELNRFLKFTSHPGHRPFPSFFSQVKVFACP